LRLAVLVFVGGCSSSSACLAEPAPDRDRGCVDARAAVPARAAFALPYEPVAVRVGASATTAVWFWYTLWMNTLVALLALVIVDRLRTRRQAIERLADHQERGRIVAGSSPTRSCRQSRRASIRSCCSTSWPREALLRAGRRTRRTSARRADRIPRAALPRLRSVRSSLKSSSALSAAMRMLRAAGDAAIEPRRRPATLAMRCSPGVLLPLLARRSRGAVDRCIELMRKPTLTARCACASRCRR
jgi:hypothetical protein